MKSIKEIENLEGKRVIVRCDFNVPLKDGEILEDYRIKQSLETINYLLENKAKVLLISHIVDKNKKPLSLRPVHNYLQKITSGLFFASGLTELGEIMKELNDGGMVLLENLRFWDGEKANDIDFTEKLASFGDIFVNEAFSVSHRKHASIVGLPRLLPGYAGFLLEKEVENLSKSFSPSHPFVFILGGAKFQTKLPVVEKFLNIADKVVIGGALANDFYKTKGYEIGSSLVSDEPVKPEILNNPKIIIPEDVIVLSSDGKKSSKLASEVSQNDFIKDAGPAFSQKMKDIVEEAKFILWNGPLGAFEEGFSESTEKLAECIASSEASSVVGGGDTLASVESLGFEKFSFVSTGGGAMLDFLANGTLPGIESL